MLTYICDIFRIIFVIKCVANLVPKNKDYSNPFGLLGVMMMIGKQFLCVFTVFIGLTVTGVQAGAVVLTMGSAAADPRKTVTVNISVEATFFDTFLNQWISLNPLPSLFHLVTATADSQTLLSKTGSIKLLLAGARVKAGLIQATLFQGS